MNNNDIKILIVEDEVIVAMEIEMGLVSQGYKVVGKAYNSGKAVDAALKQDPDIILMDINIKGGSDGIQTSKDILKSVNSSIIFLSAYNDNETKERMKEIQPHYFMPKP